VLAAAVGWTLLTDLLATMSVLIRTQRLTSIVKVPTTLIGSLVVVKLVVRRHNACRASMPMQLSE